MDTKEIRRTGQGTGVRNMVGGARSCCSVGLGSKKRRGK